jgi:hypothetical protein
MSNNNTNTNTVNNNVEEKEVTEFEIKVTESKGIEYPVIQDGVYTASVEKIVLKSNVKGKDGYFNMLIWSFVVNDDGEMKFIEGTSSAKVTTMSKAYSWIASITGKEPELNKGFIPSMVKGLPCQVVIKNTQQKNEFNGKVTEVTKPEVKEVLRAKKSK